MKDEMIFLGQISTLASYVVKIAPLSAYAISYDWLFVIDSSSNLFRVIFLPSYPRQIAT